ncbi:MAG TPA: hypothetical protein VMF91_11485 [Bryobacteraceae bacterium]|nr:hypothetical protein [Bryobacteraceae bacterium]
MKFAALFLFVTIRLYADGGSVLLRQQSNGFLLTVFGTPQVGTADISVLVQNASDRSPILDAEVRLRTADFSARATHEQATNKLLYAALVDLPRAGKYHLQVQVASNGKTAVADGVLDVAPAAPSWIAYWPYFALVPAAMLLFVLNQWLKNRRVRRPEARPSPHCDR